MVPLPHSPVMTPETAGLSVKPKLKAAELLRYASLLSGLGIPSYSSTGGQPGALLADLEGAHQEVEGRTCIDAGSSLMFSLVAPGKRSLRVLSRLEQPTPGVVSWQRLHQRVGQPPERWRSETYLGEPAAIWDRIQAAARRAGGLERLQRAHAVLGPRGRIYSLSYRLDDLPEATVSWQLDRFFRLDETLERMGFKGAWEAAAGIWEAILGFPASLRTGPWSILIPLCGPELRLRIGSTNWARLPEGAEKRRRLAGLVERLGGDGRYAQALYQLIEGAGRTGRRPAIGRAVEVELEGSQVLAAEFYLCMP